MIVYDLFRDRLYPLFLPALGALFFRNYDGLSWQLFLAILIFSAVSLIIEYLDRRMSALSHELIVTRDDAVEYNNELKNKNQRILEAQDAEVHLATLKERNRIAREIHDNVGHMLTRTILQTGALQIINKDENLKEPLESIKNTLDEAMNQVRKSVHDLHDDSVDLEGSLKEAIEPLRERFAVTFEYDVSENVNGKIKYCFIALVKEAVNNIIKHSSGDRALITLREHPGMFTLLVQDNGNCEGKNISEGGIGRSYSTSPPFSSTCSKRSSTQSASSCSSNTFTQFSSASQLNQSSLSRNVTYFPRRWGMSAFRAFA